eukprot:m.11737 g.11737  ORF g.11737 m.11737 type:complete len:567 (+) comp4511_c0_seq1:3-1703(+)
MALLLLFMFTGAVAGNSPASIVFLQCDEMDGRVLDPKSPFSKIVSTPNLDKLAASGVSFVTYANNPLCAPSRASMFTGRYTSSIRAYNNVKAITADVTNSSIPDPTCAKIVGYGPEWCVQQGKLANIKSTINLAFENAGWNVHLVGKMDTGGGPKMNPPLTFATGYHDNGNWSNKLGPPDTYFPGDFLHSWARSANISKPALAPLEGPNTWINLNNPDGGPFPNDWKVTDECIKFLNDLGGKAVIDDTPFFLYCSVLNPHPPYFSNATFEAYVNQTALNISIVEMKKDWVPQSKLHPAVRYSSITEGISDYFDVDLVYKVNLAYYGQVAQVDYMFGKIIDALTASGKEATIVFTSDHGEQRLQHQLVEKMTMYEGSARVPLIISGAGVARKGTFVTNLASLVDLFPTFLDLAGISIPSDLSGQSLKPVLSNNVTLARDFVVSEFLGDEANTGEFMIRQGKWKLTVYGNDHPYENYVPQLFNLESDPNEMNNVASTNPNIVNMLEGLLMTQINYTQVNRDANNEGRECVKRWMASYESPEEWKNLMQHAYQDFDSDDFQKFEDWLNA